MKSMEKEKFITDIVSGRNIPDSEEFLDWLRSSEENQKEFVRFKNTWALLQRGAGMDEQQISEGYNHVKHRLGMSRKSAWTQLLIRYAAVFIFLLAGSYFLYTLTVKPEISLNQITVPNGNRSQITLSDGSMVWLTNGSKLVYPEKFQGNTREVVLEGEAYFNVTHNEKKSFLVKIGEHRIKVLGTEFSVMAYPGDEIIQVDLVSGKVQMDISTGKGDYQSYILKPLHSLIVDKTSGKLTQARITDGFYSYWQFGIYSFKDESFGSLATKIERIYGVEVIFEDEGLKQRTFTGTFSIDDNIYTMMEVFRRASARPFEYRMDKKRIFIKSVK
jgi:transmembrane sensor